MDIQASASALYDGGWRAGDKEQLMAEYGLSTAQAESICELLGVLKLKGDPGCRKPDYCLYEDFPEEGYRQCNLSSYGLDCRNNKIMDNKEADDDEQSYGYKKEG